MARRKNYEQNVEKKESQKGYIVINKKLRLKVETNCLTLEELIGNDNMYGNYKYFSSWGNVLDYLVKKFSAEKISKKEILTFQEAKAEILSSINDVKNILLGEIEQQMKTANNDIKHLVNKFAKY